MLHYYLLGLKIPIWGTFFAIAIIVGALILIYNFKKNNMFNQFYMNAVFHSVFWGLLGMNIYHMAFVQKKLVTNTKN